MDESQNGAMPLDALAGEVGEADLPLIMDEDAFALFYQATARRLWAYLWHVSRDRQRTDDLFQETYFRFLRGPRRFQSDEHRQHYLFRIATNLVLDDRRRPRVEVAALPPDADAAAPVSIPGSRPRSITGRSAPRLAGCGRVTARYCGLRMATAPRTTKLRRAPA